MRNIYSPNHDSDQKPTQEQEENDFEVYDTNIGYVSDESRNKSSSKNPIENPQNLNSSQISASNNRYSRNSNTRPISLDEFEDVGKSLDDSEMDRVIKNIFEKSIQEARIHQKRISFSKDGLGKFIN